MRILGVATVLLLAYVNLDGPRAHAAVIDVTLQDVVAVSVNARPYARIEVDGAELGVTPLGNVPLEVGRRTFRAHMASGEVLEREEVIGPDNRHVSFP